MSLHSSSLCSAAMRAQTLSSPDRSVRDFQDFTGAELKAIRDGEFDRFRIQLTWKFRLFKVNP